MSNANNVLAGKPLATGGVLVGATSIVGPTDATTTLGVGFKALGYVGEDGLTESTERSTDKVKAWGGDTVKVLQTEYGVSYQFTLIETMNADVLKTIYGAGNVTTTAATSTKGTLHAVKLNSDVLPRQSFVFEMKDGDARVRIYVPDGQVTEVGEVTYNDGEIISYEVTVETFRNETIGGNAVKFIDDGIKV